MRRTFVKFSAIILMVLLPLGAQAADEDIVKLVQDAAEKVLAKFKSREAELKEHPERIYDAVGYLVKPHFDFAAMAQSAMGKHWKKASASQKKKITSEFSELLIRSYGSALLSYSGKPIQYAEPRRSKDGKRVMVSSTVEPNRGKPIDIDYKLHQSGGKWKVYDVIISGITLVTNYRKSFATEISKSGIDGLIKSLHNRNQALKS